MPGREPLLLWGKVQRDRTRVATVGRPVAPQTTVFSTAQNQRLDGPKSVTYSVTKLLIRIRSAQQVL